MLAAVPTWLHENVAIGSLVVLLVVALAIIRTIQKVTTRIAILGVLVLAAAFVVLEREDIERCARTCECELVSVDVEVPFCDPARLD